MFLKKRYEYITKEYESITDNHDTLFAYLRKFNPVIVTNSYNNLSLFFHKKYTIEEYYGRGFHIFHREFAKNEKYEEKRELLEEARSKFHEQHFEFVRSKHILSLRITPKKERRCFSDSLVNICRELDNIDIENFDYCDFMIGDEDEYVKNGIVFREHIRPHHLNNALSKYIKYGSLNTGSIHGEKIRDFVSFYEYMTNIYTALDTPLVMDYDTSVVRECSRIITNTIDEPVKGPLLEIERCRISPSRLPHSMVLLFTLNSIQNLVPFLIWFEKNWGYDDYSYRIETVLTKDVSLADLFMVYKIVKEEMLLDPFRSKIIDIDYSPAYCVMKTANVNKANDFASLYSLKTKKASDYTAIFVPVNLINRDNFSFITAMGVLPEGGRYNSSSSMLPGRVVYHSIGKNSLPSVESGMLNMPMYYVIPLK